MRPPTLDGVPSDNPVPTHVLTRRSVRWGIEELGAQRLHPTFVMYLYLRMQDRAGKLDEASASSDALLSLIQMPGNPTKPYYFPLIDRGDRNGKPLPTFWRSPNIPGSWSPGSIGRQARAAWLAESGSFALPPDHVDRAFRQLLYRAPVSALAMGAYFLRNDGFVLSGEPTATDVIAGFRMKFDFPEDTASEFSVLFTTDVPAKMELRWFEPYSSPSDGAGESNQGPVDV